MRKTTAFLAGLCLAVHGVSHAQTAERFSAERHFPGPAVVYFSIANVTQLQLAFGPLQNLVRLDQNPDK